MRILKRQWKYSLVRICGALASCLSMISTVVAIPSVPPVSAIQVQTAALNNFSTGMPLPLPRFLISDETLEKWLKESGMALVKSFASQEFPSLQAAQIAQLQIGKPVKVYSFKDETDVNGWPIITQSKLRVAPISDSQGNALGMIQIELDTDATSTRKVFGDAKLAQHLLPPPASSQQVPDAETLIYDTELKAWFAVKGKSILAASASGENLVLGTVPLEVFYTQRKGIISDGETADSLEKQQVTAPQIYDSTQWLASLIVAGVIAAILVFSLAWLIWESRFERARKQSAADALWYWATGHHRTVRSSEKVSEIGKKKVKFSESSGEVTLYESPPGSVIQESLEN
ncbi:hypothetical protein [Arcanobacterium hippocoleae]|uniref:hypothetical protein n=1 Tax=Arcanobacterium hippocoleae TaxID=149017 RepID=UPI00333E3181